MSNVGQKGAAANSGQLACVLDSRKMVCQDLSDICLNFPLNYGKNWTKLRFNTEVHCQACCGFAMFVFLSGAGVLHR